MKGMAGRRRWYVVGALLLVAATAPLSAPEAHASTEPAHFEVTPIASWRIDGVGYATLVVGDTVYVGGDFSTVRSPDGATTATRRNLAAFDVNTGALRTGFTADTNGVVRALASSGPNLFVGGSFSTIRGVARSRLAAVDLGTGAVDTTLSADANSNVYALAVGGGQLFVGGSFSTLKRVGRSRVGAVNLSDWSVSPYSPVLDNTVAAIATDDLGSNVYLGGAFTTVNGFARPWVARTSGVGVVSSVTWDQLQGPGLDLELDATGTRLAVAQGGAGNQGSWYNVDTGARLWRQRCDGDAQATHIIDGTVLTGFHEACDSDTTQRLTANAAADGGRDATFMPTFDKFWGVRGIAGDAQHLVIAGDFTVISGVSVSGFAIFPYRYVPPPPASLSSAATWRYLVTPSAPADSWIQAEFDDSAWPSGPAQLGFGDGDEATVIGYGPNSSSKYITTYFRSTFTATNVPETITLDLLADDGAVVYVNGIEVARDNMPTGPITWSTRAATGRSGAAESTLRQFAIPPTAVAIGTNTIAVEVHQDTPGSSDLSFAAGLTSTGDPNPTTTSTTTTVGETTTTSTTTTVGETTTTTSTTTTVPETTTTTSTTTTVPETTTTTSTTTTVPETTTTTVAPTTTTTTIPSGPVPLYTDSFSGADSSPWPGWATSAASGSVTLQGNAGQLAFTDTANAFARAQLNALAPRADSTVLLSYRWSGTGPKAYLNVYSRGSGGWANAYRPRDGYGLELASDSSTVTVRKVAGGTVSSLRSVANGQAVTSQKQWMRLRVVGSTIQFRIWTDGQVEPTTWQPTATDTGVTSSGQLFVSLVRGGANSGAKSVAIDDLAITDGS